MMKSGNKYATAVRDANEQIRIDVKEHKSILDKFKFLKIPFVRGIFAFYDAMLIGSASLNFASSVLVDGVEEEKTKLDKFLENIFGSKAEKIVMNIFMIFSVIFALFIFLFLPLQVGNLVRIVSQNYYIASIFEGIFRLVIFIVYILLISQTKDIKRTFMYHGAEHKCINCLENGYELNVENVMKASSKHKRCGTSFIVIVMLISISFFMFIRVDNVFLKLGTRLLLIPVIAGISYEILSLAGRVDNKLIDVLSFPGLCMQTLTVKEPDEKMVEVAIAATEQVFDWKKYLKDNF